MIDASELVAFSADLGKMAAGTAGAVFDVYHETARDLRDEWRKNATETAGEHGKLYPKSVTFDMRVSSSIVAEIGPDPSMPQGGMSFEFGSDNQPPHLDGQFATDTVVPRLHRRLDAALGHLLGELA